MPPNEEQTTQRVLPPEGRFRGKVVSHDLSGEENAPPTVAIEFAFSDNEGKEHRATKYLYFTPKTIEAGKVFEALEALKWNPEKEERGYERLAKKSEFTPDGGVLIGREADITIEHEDEKKKNDQGVLALTGKKRAVVAWVNPPGGGLGMKAPAESAQQVSSAADRIRALAGSGPAPTTGPAKTAAGAGKKSDALPF